MSRERTFIAIKPDGVQRGLVGEIIKRFEQKGYKLVALKMVTPTKEFAEKHYADLSSKPFFGGLVEYFSSGSVVAMCWEGEDATHPKDSAPGTIRGDFAVDIGRNICHGSDGKESAEKELQLWFGGNGGEGWQRSTEKWIHEKPL